MRFIQKLIILSLFLLLAGAVAGCNPSGLNPGGKDPATQDPATQEPETPDPGDDNPDNPTPHEEDVPVSGITLNLHQLELWEGASETLVATVDPANATKPAVSWSSSNTTVAIVTAGQVTGLQEGTAVITAKAGACTDACTVTVKKKNEGGNEAEKGQNEDFAFEDWN